MMGAEVQYKATKRRIGERELRLDFKFQVGGVFESPSTSVGWSAPDRTLNIGHGMEGIPSSS